MKNKTERIFIVAPQYDEDTVHVVCKTLDKDNLWDIYQTDRYLEIARVDNMKDAVRIAKKHGAKKPKVI